MEIENLGISYQTPGFVSEQGRNILTSFWFWLIIILILLFIFSIYFLRRYFKKLSQYKFSFENTVLLVKVSKEKLDKEENQKSIKELLQPTENFFANLGGLKAQRGFKAWLFGRNDLISFEIIADKEGMISFYVVTPRKIQRFFEQQLQAQYPAAQIEEVEDYNIFLPKGEIMAAGLKLKNYSMFPIKSYLKMETDPLNAITNSLSRIAEQDAAAIQIIVRSSHPSWRSLGTKVASQMQQGKNLHQAIKASLGGLPKFLKGIFEMINPSKSASSLEQQKPHQHSPMEQEVIKSLEEKASKAGLDVNIRVVVSAPNKVIAESYLDNIVNSFAQYTGYEYGNGFKRKKMKKEKIIENFIYRNFDEKNYFVLNTEEMTSIFHFPLSTTETPNIRWLTAKKAPAPLGIPKQGIILGENIYRGEKKVIRFKEDDRQRHTYIIGRTGTGKSKLMAYMAVQDILNGDGICMIDPHGELVADILERIPKERAEDVIYFDPSNIERPMGLNLMEFDPKYPEQKTFVINEMINIFDKLYDLKNTGGPMFEHYMRNAMLLLMEHPESGATLMEIPKILSDPDFRRFKLKHCKNQSVYDFWVKEAEKAGGEASLANMTTYITSKLTQFISNDYMWPIIGQQKSAFNFRRIMDEKKILLINLSKGKIGDMNAYLLGLVLMGKILMAALSRTDIPESERQDFYLYIDEFQNFITESINVILAEARKYKLCLTMAHQYIGQLVKNQDTSVRDAIFGTVGTLVSFKIGIEDAEFLAKEFAPVFSAHDLVNVESFNAYIKLLVDNQSLMPFNIKPPYIYDVYPGNQEVGKMIKDLSQLKYGKSRELIQREIKQRSQLIEEVKEEIPNNF